MIPYCERYFGTFSKGPKDVCKAQKFNYLRGHVMSRQLLEGFSTTDVCYSKAVTLLLNTYGQNYIIIKAHLHTIFDIEAPKGNCKDLRTFMSG